MSSPTDILPTTCGWIVRFVDFKTILNLIYHLDSLFTEELCTPGLWASGESVAAVEGGEKKGQRWQGNGSSLSRRLCWSTAHHWWVPEESLEQTDGVAPYISHERRLSRNNTSMEMTCRRCNPGLPVCLALLRRASACRTFHIRQYNKQRLSLKPLWVRVWSVLSRYRMCAAGARLSLRSSSADQFFLLTGCVMRGDRWGRGGLGWGKGNVSLCRAGRHRDPRQITAHIWICLRQWSYLLQSSMQTISAAVI